MKTHLVRPLNGEPRNQISGIFTAVLTCLIFPYALLAAAPAQPTALAAGRRAGQTFITWTERADLVDEQYRIYRHTAPISAANLSQATRLATVPEDSGVFYADRYNLNSSGDWQTRYLERYVIADNASPLAAGVGLLVWTIASADFSGGMTGVAYYAVTTVDRLGAENTADFSAANSIGPIAEGVADPLPVHTAVNVGARGHLYIQYMDLRQWNATFHAPNAGNEYYGLDSASAAISNAFQYAYTYVVYEPENSPSGAVPVCLYLHGWDGNSYPPMTEDPDPWGWATYKIYPIDISETWFFGFARQQDYRRSLTVASGDTIVNYTEQRLLRMIYDLCRNPPRQPVDINRLYVYGSSMGGSGTLALALRYPNVFAAAYASVPMTNYRTDGDGGGTDWRGDVEWKWGALALNLPVQLNAPAGLAAHLQHYNGTGVWDWQNHQASVLARVADEVTPLGIAHGLYDMTIEWDTQGAPFYSPMNASRRCWGGAVTETGHEWQNFDGLPPTMGLDSEYSAPFAGFKMVRNETVPGLMNASANLDLPPTGAGGYNQTIEWSASWRNWDNPPVDTTNRWEISLRTTDYSTQTADIVPRRAQSFRASSGASVNWVNRSLGDGTTVQSGMVFADANGLVTVRNVLITGAGNRLSLTLGSYDPGDITNGVPVAADFDGDRLTDPALYDDLYGTWVIYLSSAGYTRVVLPGFLGGAGWMAMAADYDGDGKADPAVYEIATGTWSVKMTTADYFQVDMPEFFGGESWAPVAADFDGDGVGDPAVYEEVSATWQFMLSGSYYTYIITTLGRPGYAMMAADFDGDRLADPAQYAADNWYVRFSSAGYRELGPYPLTLAGGLPSVGDFDGDRLADPAMVKLGRWTIWFSSAGYRPFGPFL